MSRNHSLLAIVWLFAALAPSALAAEPKAPSKEGGDQVFSNAVGFWAPNPEKLVELTIKQSKIPLERGDVTKEEVARMVRQMAGQMVFEVRGNLTMKMHAEFSSKEGTIKILASRPDRSGIDADMEASDGELEKATIALNGDRMVLKHREGDGDPKKTPTIVFDRLTRAEAEKRIAAIKKAELE